MMKLIFTMYCCGSFVEDYEIIGASSTRLVVRWWRKNLLTFDFTLNLPAPVHGYL